MLKRLFYVVNWVSDRADILVAVEPITERAVSFEAVWLMYRRKSWSLELVDSLWKQVE